MERSCRMKRIVMGVATFMLACTIAVSQVSLLNESTNGLFKNVNDYVIKPNVNFNTVKTKPVLIGGGFNDMTFKSNTNGGGLIGYYHPGKMPWSVALALDMKSEKVQNTLKSVSELAGKIQVSGVPTLVLNNKILQTIDVADIQEAINAMK